MKECTWEEVCREASNVMISDDRLKHANIVLFGSGRHGVHAYERLKNNCKIIAFSDNDPKKWGGYGVIPGVEIIEPDRLPAIDNLIVLITTSGRYCNDIKIQLDKMGVDNYLYSEYVIAQNFDKIYEVYDSLLDDEESRRAYRNEIMFHLCRDEDYMLAVYTRHQYFDVPQFMSMKVNDVFVDCGAWGGDTIEQFVKNRSGLFKRIYAFEPEDKAYKSLNVRVKRVIKENVLEEDQIIAVKSAVSDKDGELTFVVNGRESVAAFVADNVREEEAIHIPTVSLDSYFKDKEDKPTFIKADIEGSECEMICGAKGIISEYKPLVAVCIYHWIEDLYELPLMIHEINSNYRMAVRHHLPEHGETVLYCY